MKAKRPKIKQGQQGDTKVVKEEEVCVCMNLRKAARVITHIYDEVMRPLGYRGTQMTLLGVVSKFQPIHVKELAGFIDTDPTTLLRNLRLLEKNKLVLLEEGKKDRRQRYALITPQGIKVLKKAYPLWKQTQDRIAEKVGRKRLNSLLDDLQGALEQIQKG